jgi:hypothetical protein
MNTKSIVKARVLDIKNTPPLADQEDEDGAGRSRGTEYHRSHAVQFFLFLSRTRRGRAAALLTAAAAADLIHPAGAHKELKQLVGAVHVDRQQLARACAL